MEAFRCLRAWGQASYFHSTTSSRPLVTRGSASTEHAQLSEQEGRVGVSGVLGVGGALSPGPAPSSSILALQRPEALPVLRCLPSFTTLLYPAEPR